MARGTSSFEVSFPFGGLNEYMGFENQDRTTSFDLKNVRATDPSTGRNRGGQRPGLAKYNTSRTANGFVQDIGHVAVSKLSTAQTEVAARTLYNYAVTNGTVAKFDNATTFTTATGGSSALDATIPVVFSTELFGVVYFADGTNHKKWTASTNTVATWSASAGSLPSNGGNTARLCCTWRGRIVLSGISTDAHNWFMSAVGDADDWDYSPATEVVTQAVAGNNTEAGYSPDVINGLLPYNDDILIMFGDHTIHQLTGDPAEGGRIDLITDQVGGAWGRAFCRDPQGAIYFFGSRGGVYRMVPGSQPESITLGAIEERLADVDLSDHLIRMEWSDREKGLYLFITPLDGSATENYFYDARNQGWFKDVFATATQNPTSVHTLDGDVEGDRFLVIGGQDGYIRSIDVDADDDDGVAIDSYAYLGPIQFQSRPKLMLEEIHCTLGTGSADVTLTVHNGQSAEVAKAAAADFTVTVSADRNKVIRDRSSGHSFYVKLANSTLDEEWALERLFVKCHTFDGPRARQW